MLMKTFLDQVKTCFCQNKVEILPIFISFYFVKGQPIPQYFCGRMRVLNEHYNRESKVLFQVSPEKSYGQLKTPKVKLCKCAVASIVNGFQKYFTSWFVTLGPS